MYRFNFLVSFATVMCFLISCDGGTVLSFASPASPAFSTLFRNNQLSSNQISICADQTANLEVVYRLGNRVLINRSVRAMVISSVTVQDTNLATISKDSVKNSSFIIQGLEQGKTSVYIEIMSPPSISSLVLRDTLNLNVLESGIGVCAIKKEVKIVKKGSFLARNLQNKFVSNLVVGDTAPVTLTYFENDSSIENISVHWDSSQSNGIYKMKNLMGEFNSIVTKKEGSSEILIYVISIEGDTIFTDTIFIVSEDVAPKRINYSSKSQLLDRNNIAFCLDSSLSLSAAYLRNNELDSSVEFLWQTRSSGSSIQLSDTIEIKSTQSLTASRVGIDSLYISVFDNENMRLFLDTIEVNVKSSTDPVCFANKSIVVSDVTGTPLSLNAEKRMDVNLGLIDQNFTAFYTENGFPDIGVTFIFDTSLSQGVYSVRGTSQFKFTLKGLKDGSSLLILEVNRSGKLLFTDTISIHVVSVVGSGTFPRSSSYGIGGSFSITNSSVLFNSDFTFTGTAPGPVVYLSNTTNSLSADAISLGPIESGMNGPFSLSSLQADPSNFSYLVIWCEPFSVGLGSARIQSE